MSGSLSPLSVRFLSLPSLSLFCTELLFARDAIGAIQVDIAPASILVSPTLVDRPLYALDHARRQPEDAPGGLKGEGDAADGIVRGGDDGLDDVLDGLAGRGVGRIAGDELAEVALEGGQVADEGLDDLRDLLLDDAVGILGQRGGRQAGQRCLISDATSSRRTLGSPDAEIRIGHAAGDAAARQGCE